MCSLARCIGGGGERQWILETSDKIPLQIKRIHAGLHVKRCEFPGGVGGSY